MKTVRDKDVVGEFFRNLLKDISSDGKIGLRKQLYERNRIRIEARSQNAPL